MNCKNLTKSKPCESINKFTTATWVFFWNLLKLLKKGTTKLQTSAAAQLQMCQRTTSCRKPKLLHQHEMFESTLAHG